METKRPPPPPSSLPFFLLPSAISDSLRHELTLDLRVLIAFNFEAGSHRDYVVTHTRTHYGHSEEGLADLAHTYSAQLSNYSRAKTKNIKLFKFKNVFFSACLQLSNFSLDERRVFQTYVTLQHNLRKKGRNIKEWITKIDARLILRFLLEVRLQFESLSNNRAN